jgi:hypothetical protein
MIDKAHLQGKNVGVRISSLPVAVPATVSFVEQDGIWLVGQDLVNHLTKSGGGMPVGGKAPAVYVPFSQILWLVAPNE